MYRIIARRSANLYAIVTSSLFTNIYNNSDKQPQSVSGGYSKNYTYNSNGSMISDGTLNIQYNEVDLPKQVTGTPVGAVSYSYDATGTKLTKQTTTETRQYIGGIEYNGSIIDILHTENGVARNNAGTYTYEFFLKDHLGNVRIMYNNGGTVLQQTDYYGFGMSIKRVDNNQNKYLYNGKGQQQELGGTDGGQFDYGARFYDPIIARWHVIDPLSERSRKWSAYNYAYNNPLRFIDPDGMSPTDWVRWTDKYGDQHADYVASVKNQSQAEEWVKTQDADATKISNQKEGIVDRAYTDADGTRRAYKLNENGAVTALEYGKPTATEHDIANAEPVGEEGGVSGGIEGGEVGGSEDGKNSSLDITDRVNDGVGMTNSVNDAALNAVGAEAKTMGSAVEGLRKATRGIGLVSAGIDASIAIKQAYDNGTAGGYLKAGLKTSLFVLEIVGKVNPVVGVVTGILDLTGVTDKLFEW